MTVNFIKYILNKELENNYQDIMVSINNVLIRITEYKLIKIDNRIYLDLWYYDKIVASIDTYQIKSIFIL